MLKGIHERGLSKQHQVKIQNFPGGTSETILDVVDTLVTNKPDCIIVHACTNDISRSRSRTAATSKMELFVIIFNSFQLLTIITKCSVLDVAAVLDPPLIRKGINYLNSVKKIVKKSSKPLRILKLFSLV